MKEKYVERNVVSSKINKHKNVLTNDTFNGVLRNKKRVKRIISNTGRFKKTYTTFSG